MTNLKTLFEKAVQLHQSGSPQEAIPIYLEMLLADNSNPYLLFLAGSAFGQIGHHTEGITYLQKSAQLVPNPISLNNLALSLLALGRHTEAINSLKLAIKLDPNYSEGFCNLGIAQRNAGLPTDSIHSFEKSIRLAPNNRQAFIEKGISLSVLGDYSQSLECLKVACKLDPAFPDTYKLIGDALIRMDKIVDSLPYYDKAIQIKPTFVEAYSSRGGAQKKLDKFGEALTDYNIAIELKPDYAEAYCNRGNTLKELYRLDEALADYNKAIELKPDYAEAYSNRGNTLKQLNRLNETLADYKTALQFKSDIKYLLGTTFHIKMHLCDWIDFEGNLNELVRNVSKFASSSPPFALQGLIDSADLQNKCAQTYIRDKYPLRSNPLPKTPRTDNHKIKIGYFSSDFGNHPVTHLLAGLFEVHDKGKFEIYAFSLQERELDEWRNRVINGVDHFIDVSKKSDSEIATLSRSLQIDIAVDLNGHTTNARTGIFSYRTATVQTSYIGFLGTMGENYYDYLIADAILIPEESRDFYAEKIAYLPSYQCNDNKFEVSDRIYNRNEFDLPEEAFIFCSFNNNWKITPSVFDSWMKILDRVPHSVLWIYVDNATAESNLRKEAKNRGIDPIRLVFASKIPLAEHLSRLRLADIFLDTFPYNAGATASNALRVGLPLITMTGESFPSRYGASILNAIGMTELIAETTDEFEFLAIDLATHPERLAKIKDKLANNLKTTSLFDTVRFTKSLESAFMEMHHRSNCGLPSDHIFVSH